MQVGFKSSGTAVSQLTYLASVTGLNGTWHGIQNVTDQFVICGTRLNDAREWAKFGTNFVANCQVELAAVLNKFSLAKGLADQVLFYDVYVHFPLPRNTSLSLSLFSFGKRSKKTRKNAREEAK